MAVTTADLVNRFTYHSPDGLQREKYEQIRNYAHGLAALVNTHCPDSREKALAFTNIEQAVMWANAAIARHEVKGEPDPPVPR